ncbi:MAG TPA: hypothetical protein VND68_04805, partial [Chloroflexia bacterium]|nr:hypothetical protein [Chloroflexia bacterium]
MNLTDFYLGSNDPFEGDQTIWLRSLPVGARVTRATLRLIPRSQPGERDFTERIAFNDLTGTGYRGAMREPARLADAGPAAVADLHARRTVSGVTAAQEGNRGSLASVQMDIGGIWVGLASDGTILAPDKQPLVLILPPTPASGEPGPTPLPLPLLTTSRIKLTAVSDNEGTPAGTGNVSLYGVSVRSIPAGISVRLGQMPPFWVRVGELSAGEVSPDFAPVLNAFLASAPAENGFYAVAFVLHSDSIARLDVEASIDYMIDQEGLPPHLPEVTLTYNTSAQPLEAGA